MKQISPHAAAKLLEEQPDAVLLDVREAAELEAAAIARAMHIPMQEVPQRLAELDPASTILCMCHLGGRSAMVAEYLAQQGYEKVLNVAGGIDAWAAEIDPSLPRY